MAIYNGLRSGKAAGKLRESCADRQAGYAAAENSIAVFP